MLSIAIAIFIVNDLLNLCSGYQAFKFYSTLAAIMLIILASGYSIYNVARPLLIKEISIKTSKLPNNIAKFTIVQLSDIHLNFFKSSNLLKEIVERTNQLNPDLVVITGDMIDADLCKVNGFCDLLGQIKSKNGVYAVTGNHEYYSGIAMFMNIAKASGITVLRNSKILVGGVVEVVGIDDKEFNKPADSLIIALNHGEKLDTSKFTILLSHQPDIFDLSRESGIDLQLSGHTHAGQLPPMDLIVKFAYKYPLGLYHRGNSYLYTSPGTGIWGPPMRLTSRSEIVKITLER